MAFDDKATETTAVSGSQAAATADLLGVFLEGTSETIMEKDGASLKYRGAPSYPISQHVSSSNGIVAVIQLPV